MLNLYIKIGGIQFICCVAKLLEKYLHSETAACVWPSF